jgi:hypothetical protein
MRRLSPALLLPGHMQTQASHCPAAAPPSQTDQTVTKLQQLTTSAPGGVAQAPEGVEDALSVDAGLLPAAAACVLMLRAWRCGQ